MFKNIAEVQIFRKKFEYIPPIQLTICRIKDKFETDGIVKNVHKQ